MEGKVGNKMNVVCKDQERGFTTEIIHTVFLLKVGRQDVSAVLFLYVLISKYSSKCILGKVFCCKCHTLHGDIVTFWPKTALTMFFFSFFP